MIKHKLIQIIIPVIAVTGLVFGQHVPTSERGDPNYRRQTDLDGNKVRTTIFNFGVTGRTGATAGMVPYEWPINTGRHYIAMTQLFVGGEVMTEEGVIKHLVDIPNGREDNDGNSMNFEPVPEYLNANSDKIAKSDEPDTWPEYWPDKLEDETDPGWEGAWNGYFGKDQFNADQEMYFKISDDHNFLKGYTYCPDTTDYTRKGLGILAGVRVLAWSQVLVEDVVFVLNEIKNDGTKDIDKVAFTLWLADLVGGDGDNSDDSPDFDLIYDIAWSMDGDGIGNSAFGSDRVGVAATAYLETPGNNVDRIDNDGDGEENGPKMTEAMIIGEDETNSIDDNYNGLIDENQGHVPFNGQEGVTYKNGIDDNGNAETNSPTITEEMISAASSDVAPGGYNWRRWPPFPETDSVQDSAVHLIMVESSDLGKAFADNIDNDNSQEYPYGTGADTASPRITWEIIAAAASDPYRRYRVPGTAIILYDVDSSDYNLRYADGIDNDGDGAVDEGIDEGIDEMIDESRDDYIDNDGDWNIYNDDVGRDGDLGTLDRGQGDGRPTSGTGSNLPGEPNIDKTDVSESDQMGLTSVSYDAAGSIPTGQDQNLWVFYMVPGDFWQPPDVGISGDFDLFVSSGFFPIPAGETQRIAMAVCLGADTLDARNNKDVAQKTYNEDYQFAKAPIPPTVTAIPGDGYVTLKWDNISEQSFDTYMYSLGEIGYDFEGYKIYKSSDAAFQDNYSITDASGNLIYNKPIAQYDQIDGREGWHEVSVNGTSYNLGSETGLAHSYTDYDVLNGYTYYYAVVAYDFGGNSSNDIPPTESTMRITVNSVTGAINTGTNVVVVTPNPAATGYTQADIDTIEQVQGTSTAYLTFTVVDPLSVLPYHRYKITFEDTTKPASSANEVDTLTTKNYSMFDITDTTSIDTLLWKNTDVTEDKEQPIVDGLQLTFHNEDFVYIDYDQSYWNHDSMWTYVLEQYSAYTTKGKRIPADYKIIVGADGIGTSTYYKQFYSPFWAITYPAKAVNFFVEKRVDITGIDSLDWVDVPFAFGDFSPSDATDGNDILDADSVETDWVIFMDDTTAAGEPSPSWVFKMSYPRPSDKEHINGPAAGDTLLLRMRKPFLSKDIFEFTSLPARIDTALAKKELSDIVVVPNPYRAAAAWEKPNNYSNGRGDRAIKFFNLPNECTIRIFTVSGELVKTIRHEALINNGTATWDVLTKENLSAAYGVYIYHVDAPGIGEHIGKFAVIK